MNDKTIVTDTMPNDDKTVEALGKRAQQLGEWFAEYAEHHKAKAEAIEALPNSEAWQKVERNLERARFAYTLQDDLAALQTQAQPEAPVTDDWRGDLLRLIAQRAQYATADDAEEALNWIYHTATNAASSSENVYRLAINTLYVNLKKTDPNHLYTEFAHRISRGVPWTEVFDGLDALDTETLRQHDQGERALWLWRNGEDEYVAYDNPFPTIGGGDPLVIGEPWAIATLKPSTNGKPDYPLKEVRAAMQRAKRPQEERDKALEEAASVIQRRMDVRFEEHGTREWDTNACYYEGSAGETYEALDEEAEELIAAIRALKGATQ